MATENRGRPSAADTGSFDGQDDLARQLSDFARTVQQQPDTESTLDEVVRAAVQLIPGCDEGSISVVLGRRTVSSQSASGTLPQIVDALQEKLGEGPCLDAAYQQMTVRVPDMTGERRWPKFSAAAASAGAAGMLSFQLYVEGDNLGALNLYSHQAWAFNDESEHVGLMFAAHAAVAFAASQQQAKSNRVIATKQLIGVAQGILVERHKLTPDQAFALLVRVSQHRNTKLNDLAHRLVDTGHLEAGPPDTRGSTRAMDASTATQTPDPVAG